MPDGGRLPWEAQVEALAALLRGGDSPAAQEAVRQFLAGVNTTKALERLRQLEERAGKHPALEILRLELEERQRMTCPRCALQLRKPEMEQHLWDEHRLVLDGRRVREPWGLIAEWARSMSGQPDAEVMIRCQTLAARLDPENGPAKLRRIYLAAGVADEETRRTVVEEARHHHASLCPVCYAEVPVALEAPLAALELRHGRLYAKGFSVELSEKGWRPRLEVRTPERILYRGREPGRLWTRTGARGLLVGVCVLLALLCACFAPATHQLPFALAAAYLLAAICMEAVVRQVWAVRVPMKDRLFDYTWRYLVPQLHKDGYRVEDSAFAIALVEATPAGRASVGRAPLLQELVQRTEVAVREARGPAEHLAILRRLLIADAVAGGADPVPLVLAQLVRCFEGNVTLAYAEQLLRGWHANWWTPGNRARLRVLLCDRAFEAGFEVADLLETVKTAPALSTVLDIEQPLQLAGLRYLWSLRATQPWEKFEEAETVFTLAASAEGAALLAECPDLLLMQQVAQWRVAGEGGRGKPSPARILLRVSGVMLQDVLYTAPPNFVEMTERAEGQFLVLGKGLFRSPDKLDDLSRRMEGWFRYWFHEFLPQAPGALTWRAPVRTAILRAWGALPCPECKHLLRPRAGEVGIAVEEA